METWIHDMICEHDYDAVDVAEYKFYVEQIKERNERHIAHTFSMSPEDYEQPLSFEDWKLSRLSNPHQSWLGPF
tara:strand:- start:114 stop:335 length:222 start_codon:yes stop_codon:yes gene_type:complete